MNQRQISELLKRLKEIEDRLAQLENRKKPGPKPQNG